MGCPLFQLAMSCQCCEGRVFWLSQKEIQRNGCPGLEELIAQVQELQMNGVDIATQMGNCLEESECEEEDSFEMYSPENSS
jgi:hypothetical protein